MFGYFLIIASIQSIIVLSSSLSLRFTRVFDGSSLFSSSPHTEIIFIVKNPHVIGSFFTGACGFASGTDGVSGMFDDAGGVCDCSIFVVVDSVLLLDVDWDVVVFFTSFVIAPRFGFGTDKAAAQWNFFVNFYSNISSIWDGNCEIKVVASFPMLIRSPTRLRGDGAERPNWENKSVTTLNIFPIT